MRGNLSAGIFESLSAESPASKTEIWAVLPPPDPELSPPPLYSPQVEAGRGWGTPGLAMGGGVTRPRQLWTAKGCGGGSDIISGGGAAQLPPNRGLQAPPSWRTQGSRNFKTREGQEMKSAGTTPPLLRTRDGKSFTISATPPIHTDTATCRCRRDLSPPTHVVAAPAPGEQRTSPEPQRP